MTELEILITLIQKADRNEVFSKAEIYAANDCIGRLKEKLKPKEDDQAGA